jgi:CHAT domain-containing protein
MEAFRFSTAERSAGTAMDDYQTTCLLLQLATDRRAQVANTKDEIPWRIAVLGFKLDLGKLFASLGAKAQAEIWLANLEQELEECISLANGSAGTLRASDSLDMLTIEFYRLKIAEKEDSTQSRLQQLLILGQKMHAISHIETERTYYLAIEWAQKLYPPKEFDALRTDIQLRTQKLFETQGRVPAEATYLVDLMITKSTSFSEIARRIELIRDFDRRHPHITLPTVKQMSSSLKFRLQAQAGQREYHEMEAENNALFGSIPSSFNIRREVSNTEPNEHTLEIKDLLERQEVEDREFNLDYTFLSQTAEVAVPRLLKKLVSEEAVSGRLGEQALLQLFGSGENDTVFEREGVLELEGQELLQNLVGTFQFPLHATEWAKRRPTLRSWLLDDSSSNYRLRQCLWIAIHGFRSRTWNLHVQLNPRGIEYTKMQTPTLVKADCIGKIVKTIAPDWLKVTCQQISAIEERLDTKDVKLASSRAADHFEKDWWISRSILSQLYMNLFFCCRIPGEELGDATVGFFTRADRIAREQLTHWRSVESSQFFAVAAIDVATIAQFRIEYGIIKEPEDIGRTVDNTLDLLEEVELMFGTTLYEVDLGHSLDVLNMKSHMGSGIKIWRVGKLAIRLLHLAITVTTTEDRVQRNGDEKLATRRQQWLQQLWQWVQRVKARTLAQSMGLDNMVPDSMLAEIQKSFNDVGDSAEKELTGSASQVGQPGDAEPGERLAASKLDEGLASVIDLLPQVREILKDGNKAVPVVVINTIGSSLSQDLQRFSIILEKLKQPVAAQIDDKGKLQEELSQISQRTKKKPSLHTLVTIADFLNREEVLQNKIETTSDRFQHRIELQRLRQEMRREPVLERMFRIREGRPVSNQDLHKVAATRQGKVVFVDWFTITSSIDHVPRLYMLLWRNGICKGIDLKTEHGTQIEAAKQFFEDKDVYLPDVDPTPLKEMNLEEMAPREEKSIEDELKPVLNCFELVKPLFNDPLIKPGDMLVLSLTEGFHNFPLHAIQEDEESEIGPLILRHPVVYIPSLSVLHKCFWARHASRLGQDLKGNDKLRSLVLGGIVSPEPVFQYGGKAVDNIGGILNDPETTFVGVDATLDNFSAHIASSDILHIQLHTNYLTNKPTKSSGHGHLSQHNNEDVSFVSSPLDQAIVFNGTSSNNKLTARRIIELQLSKGAHLNLMACASGRQGIYKLGNARLETDLITDEVMGLVPAFLFSGAGSVTSTLWPIMDEHGAVFSNHFFRAFVEAREKRRSQLSSGDEEVSWIDLAEIHQEAVLAMRKIYKQPSAWAGFVLSGCWKFQI